MVAHACNPRTLEGWARRITWGQEFETSLANMVKLCPTKNIKISLVWWQTPVIPATQEAEAGELLEPGRWRLQWASWDCAIALQPGWRVRLRVKKKTWNYSPKRLGVSINYILRLNPIVKNDWFLSLILFYESSLSLEITWYRWREDQG